MNGIEFGKIERELYALSIKNRVQVEEISPSADFDTVRAELYKNNREWEEDVAVGFATEEEEYDHDIYPLRRFSYKGRSDGMVAALSEWCAEEAEKERLEDEAEAALPSMSQSEYKKVQSRVRKAFKRLNVIEETWVAVLRKSFVRFYLLVDTSSDGHSNTSGYHYYGDVDGLLKAVERWMSHPALLKSVALTVAPLTKDERIDAHCDDETAGKRDDCYDCGYQDLMTGSGADAVYGCCAELCVNDEEKKDA